VPDDFDSREDERRDQMSSRTITIVVVALVVFCCLAAALGGLAYYLMVPTAEAEVQPTVLIDSPSHGDEVTIGAPVQVFATGQDPGKIARMELWVDGQLVQSQASALPGGTSPFPIIGLWVPDTPGNHTIVVRAYNMDDVSGQASISVNAVQAEEVPAECGGDTVLEHVVQTGETVEGIAAGYEVTVEQVVACNPGLDPTAMPEAGSVLLIPGFQDPAEEDGPPDDWPPPPDAEDAPDVPEGVEELPGEDLPEAETEPEPGEEPPEDVPEAPEDGGISEVETPVVPTVTLGFEAVEFEVDQPYDEIYCLVQLADYPVERIPEAGSLNPGPDNYWDIQAELAGMNSKQITIEGDVVRVEADCYGWSGIDGWSLGHFVREHGEAEWTGEEIEVTAIADDGRWFRVVYRICPTFPCEPRPVPLAPENLTYASGCPCPSWIGCPPCPILHGMLWTWLGDEADIEGFRLYRNDTMVQEQPFPAARGMLIPDTFPDPPCGETWDYTLTAYEGPPGIGVESDPSNAESFTGPVCTTTVVVTFETLHTGCVHPDPCTDATCLSCKLASWIGVVAANEQYYNRLMPFPSPDIYSYMVHPVSYLFDGYDTLTVELDPGEDLTLGMVILDWDGPWPSGTMHPTLVGLRTIDSADVATGDYYMVVQSYAPPGVGFGVLVVHLEVLP
jgi:LysM repeat protein